MKNRNVLAHCILGILYLSMLSGCGVSNIENKTEYYIGENAVIDNYQATCNSYQIKDNILKVNLDLTSKNKEKQTVSLINNFEIINTIDNEIKPKNISSDKIEIIKDNESINIELEFDINNIDFNAKDYKIIFYSGVATNNIGFILEES